MKVLKYIFPFYVLLLSVVPCCAFDDCPDDKVAMVKTHESGDEDNCGSCSPFFNCESCTSGTTTVSFISYTPFFPEARKVYSGFISASIPETHYDFWQPPRAGI